VLLSIIIVSWNTRQDLLDCLASIMANPPGGPFEVLVFDNNSRDGSAEAVAAEYPQVRLLASPDNLGFARANNQAATLAQGQYWLLLNPDTLVHPSAIDRLVEHLAAHPGAAGVGPRLVNPDGSLQLSIYYRPTLLREWWRLFHLDRFYSLSGYPASALAAPVTRHVEMLDGACLLLRRQAIEPLGLFDEDYFIYSEEDDLCDRLGQAGWELHWLPQAVITHKAGQSTRQVADAMFVELYRNKTKFFRKRRGWLSSQLYKLILLQAALVRYLSARALQRLRQRRSEQLRDMARRYRLLISVLPSL
jgi:N-acetylglucosaminyl-diphospho-decaprenol L-rhamnosyltransferase